MQGPQQAQSTPTGPGGSAIPMSVLQGTWTAKPTDGVQIQLTLQPNKTFSWKANDHGQVNEFKGTFDLADNSLSLKRQGDNQSMDGTVSPVNEGTGFRFRMKQAEADDPGLSFTR
jgi:hypothetical protein